MCDRRWILRSMKKELPYIFDGFGNRPMLFNKKMHVRTPSIATGLSSHVSGRDLFLLRRLIYEQTRF